MASFSIRPFSGCGVSGVIESFFNKTGRYKGRDFRVDVLRKLVRLGLIEVVAMGPSVYRVTKLGEIVRRIRR